jgi:hypothetical protein
MEWHHADSDIGSMSSQLTAFAIRALSLASALDDLPNVVCRNSIALHDQLHDGIGEKFIKREFLVGFGHGPSQFSFLAAA